MLQHEKPSKESSMHSKNDLIREEDTLGSYLGRKVDPDEVLGYGMIVKGKIATL